MENACVLQTQAMKLPESGTNVSLWTFIEGEREIEQ